MASKDRADRRQRLLQETAALLGSEIDAEITKHVAVYRALRESIEVRALDGHPQPGDVAALAEIDMVIAKYVPPPKMEIRVKFVDAADTAPLDSAAVDNLRECRRCHWRPFDRDRTSRCYRCGWTHGADTAGAWTPLIAPAVDSPPAPESSPTVTAVAHNVVPMDKAERSAQLRDAALAAAPLKRHQAPTYSPNVGAPFVGAPYESPAALSRRISDAYR